jgi:hypothetical protein
MIRIFFKIILINTIFILFTSRALCSSHSLISDGGFEHGFRNWLFRGDCKVSSSTKNNGKNAVEVSTKKFIESYAYQYFEHPEKNFEATIWTYPRDKDYFGRIEIVANWDKFGADKIISISFSPDTIMVSSLDSPCHSTINKFKNNSWNKISIITDSSGFKKNIKINDMFLCSIVSDNIIPASAIIIGNFNCSDCFGTIYYDDISIISKSFNTTIYNKDIFLMKLGIGKSFAGPTFGFGLNYGKNKNLFSIRYLKGDEFRFNVEGHYDSPALEIIEVGILYGRYYRDKNVLISLSGGISIVNGVERGKLISGKEYETIEISTFGLPIEAQFIMSFSNYFGVGVSVFANVNNQKSFVGGMIGIQLGQLK